MSTADVWLFVSKSLLQILGSVTQEGSRYQKLINNYKKHSNPRIVRENAF